MSFYKTGQAIFNILFLLLIVYCLVIWIFDIDDEPLISGFLSILEFSWNNALWAIIALVCIGLSVPHIEKLEKEYEADPNFLKFLKIFQVILGLIGLLTFLILLGAILHIAKIIWDGEFGEILSNISFSYSLVIPLLIALILFLFSKASES